MASTPQVLTETPETTTQVGRSALSSTAVKSARSASRTRTVMLHSSGYGDRSPDSRRMLGAPKATTAVSPGRVCSSSQATAGSEERGIGVASTQPVTHTVDSTAKAYAAGTSRDLPSGRWVAATVSSTSPGTRPIR